MITIQKLNKFKIEYSKHNDKYYLFAHGEWIGNYYDFDGVAKAIHRYYQNLILRERQHASSDTDFRKSMLHVMRGD